MILGCDGAGRRRRRQRGHRPRGGPQRRLDRRRDARPAADAAVGAARRHAGRAGRRAAGNVVPKPEGMPWETAACLSTAWLTAYRMLFTNSGVQPGGTVLVQGAGGGVATALVQLGSAAGYRMWVTSPGRGQGRARGGDRGGPGVRVRRPAARQGRRGDGDRRRGDVDPLDQLPAPGRDASSSAARLGRRSAQGRADQDLLPPAARGRLHDGEPRRSWNGWPGSSPSGASSRSSTRCIPLADARDGFARIVDGEVFGKVVITV